MKWKLKVILGIFLLLTLALTKRHNKVEASTPIAIVATIVRLFSQFNV
jgi:hypothetical protein